MFFGIVFLMQSNNFNLSLNAIRVFATVAQHRSLKLAANALSVTPGAVSHQIKALEQRLGILLFHRTNNTIMPTDAALKFFEDVQPAILTIENAANALLVEANNLVLRINVSLGVRWLIPRLEAFKQKYPEVRITLETSHYSVIDLTPGIDIAITYCKTGNQLRTGQKFLEEYSQPLISPTLLNSLHQPDIFRIPIVSSTTDNWDWKMWLNSSKHPLSELKFVASFDTDDAAIHAAVAGMGMVMMSSLMAKNELQSGALIRLPRTSEIHTGSYWLISTQRSKPLVEKFISWIADEVKGEF